MARDYSERGFCMKKRERSKDEELKMKKERWKRVMCGSASRGEIGFGRRVQKHDVAKHLSEVSPFTSLSLWAVPCSSHQARRIVMSDTPYLSLPDDCAL